MTDDTIEAEEGAGMTEPLPMEERTARARSLMEILIADLADEETLAKSATPVSYCAGIQCQAGDLIITITLRPAEDPRCICVVRSHGPRVWTERGHAGHVIAAAREHILTVAPRRADQ